MIHYNPNEHHDKLVKHFVDALISDYELDMPFVSPQNNGIPNHALCTGDETYLFTSPEQFRQLNLDALD